MSRKRAENMGSKNKNKTAAQHSLIPFYIFFITPVLATAVDIITPLITPNTP